jgi:hypothetical protein
MGVMRCENWPPNINPLVRCANSSTQCVNIRSGEINLSAFSDWGRKVLEFADAIDPLTWPITKISPHSQNSQKS